MPGLMNLNQKLAMKFHFYEYNPPRSLAEIDADLKKVTAEILGLLGEVAE